MSLFLVPLALVVLAGPAPTPLPTVALPKATEAQQRSAKTQVLGLTTAELIRAMGQPGTVTSSGNRVIEWKQDGWRYVGEFDPAGKRVDMQAWGEGVPDGMTAARTPAQLMEIMEGEPPLVDATNVIEHRLFVFPDGSKAKATLREGKVTMFGVEDAKPPVVDQTTKAWAMTKKVTSGMTIAQAEAVAGKPVASTVIELRQIEWRRAGMDFLVLQADFDKSGKRIGPTNGTDNVPREAREGATLLEIEKILGPGTPTGKTQRIEIRDYPFSDKSRMQVRYHDGVVWNTSTNYFPYNRF